MTRTNWGREEQVVLEFSDLWKDGARWDWEEINQGRRTK
jgi:hypothetical protein